jgi:isorenieratene synthase
MTGMLETKKMEDKKSRDSISNARMSRRRFIQTGMAATALGAVNLTLPGCGGGDVYLDDYPVVPENKVSLKPNGKSVLILGGGFGGMHAACELLDRGFKVTVIEKASTLGGKLKSWRDKTFGVPPVNDPEWKGYPRDHGAHAVWGFYNNLREFMYRHDYQLWKFPRESTMYNFLDRDGSQVEMGKPLEWPGPLADLERMLDVHRAFSAMAGEPIGPGRRFMGKMVGFDFSDKKQRLYLDSLSFPEWARLVGIPDRLIRRFFGPISEMALFDPIENTSALYILMLQSLAAGHHSDMAIDIFMHPPGETYVKPIEDYIRGKGGEIVFNTPVMKIKHENGRVLGVLAGEEAPAGGVTTWKCNVCGSVFSSPTKPGRCPICGAPASEIVAFSGGGTREYVADYYVVAMDTPGAKAVSAASGLGGQPYFDNMQKLEATSVYPVNLWYANCDVWQKRFPGHADFFASSFKLLGITLNWAMDGKVGGKPVNGPLVPDYQGKNINVIETQIANTDLVKNLDDDKIARLVHEELKIVMPDLPPPTDWYVNRWDTYSPQRVGYEALRPPIQSPLDNLFYIGDWVRTDHESVYMEKTCVSAKMVTNLILEKADQKKGRIRILRSGTPNRMISLLRAVESPYP